MDDVRHVSVSRRAAVWLTLCCGMLTLPGCALGVMAGKMFFGDPKQTCDMRRFADVDLTTGEHAVLVLCATSGGVQLHSPGVEYDIQNAITRKLQTRGVNVVPPDNVASWLDEHGEWDDPAAMAEEFDADYVVLIEINSLGFREDAKSDLFRGRAQARIEVYHTQRPATDQPRIAAPIYSDSDFTAVYPTGYPLSSDNKSAGMFRKEFLTRLSGQLAQKFYDHRLSEEIY